MRLKTTVKGYVGLLVGLAGAAYLIFGAPRAPAEPGAPTIAGSPTAPTEEIDVEQAVAFPHDI